MTAVDIGKDFSRYPFGRYRADGPYSGERFREEFLIPALTKDTSEISVIFDGASGMGSSFLEEAFGGLVRKGFKKNELLSRLKILSKDATRVSQIQGYIAEAGTTG